jgi:hypothetical protein
MKLLIAAIWAATSSPVETTLNFQLGFDLGLLGIGLGSLDHLDAPGVGDESISQSNTIRPGLLVELEELGVGGPGREALGVGGGTGNRLARG